MRKTHFLIAGLFILTVVLFARLIWMASRAETGWWQLKRQFRDATVGLVKGQRGPIYMQEPGDQADFWLKEVKRITDAEPDNAELAMGAALLLDAPSPGFRYRLLTACDESYPYTGYPHIGNDGYANLPFEDKCRNQCLAMVAKATKLQPENVAWWRLRVLMLFDNCFFWTDGIRAEDCLDVIEECGRHDPDNALYDYLAAKQLWDASVEIATDTDADRDETTTKLRMRITDAKKYQQAAQHFREGQKLNKCTVDDDGTLALTGLLKKSSVSGLELAITANKRYEINRMLENLRGDLLHRLIDQIEQAALHGDILTVWILCRQQYRIRDQFCSIDPTIFYYSPDADLQRILQPFRELAESNYNPATDYMLSDIEACGEKAILDVKVYDAALSRTTNSRQAQVIDLRALAVSFNSIAALMILALMVIGLSNLASGYLMGGAKRQSPDVLGMIRHAICWLAALGLSFVVCGIIPARIVTPQTKGWIIAGLIVVTLVAAFHLLLWMFIKSQKTRYAFCALVTFLILIIVGQKFFLFFSDDPNNIQRLSVRLPARDPPAAWKGMNLGVFRYAVAWNMDSCVCSFWQWLAYMGPFVSIGIALALLGCWYHIRYKRVASATNPQVRSRWAGMFVCLGRSMLVCAWLLIIGWLWITPYFIKTAEANYQDDMAYIREPHKYQNALKAAVAEVRADKSFMATLENELSSPPAALPAITP
jgi:hypothetical protein